VPLLTRQQSVAALPASRRPRWYLVGGMILAVAAGAFIPNAHRIGRPVYLTLLGVLSVAPIVVRKLQGRFDPFEPITVVAISAFFIWFLRPLSTVMYGDWIYAGHNISRGFNQALLIAFVGLVAVYGGYSIGTGARLALKVPPLPARWVSHGAFKSIVTVLLVAAALFAAYIARGGGLHAVVGYFSSRTLGQKQLAAQSSAWLYLAPYVAIPSALISWSMYHVARRRTYLVMAILLTTLSLALTVFKGDRTYVLMIVLPLYVLPYLWSGRRPSALSGTVAVLIAILAINVMLVDRVASRRHGSLITRIADATMNPADQVKTFLTGPDISMFSSLAATTEYVPSKVAYKPGNELISVLALPFPGVLWPGKPHDGETDLFPTLYPTTAAAQRAGFGPSLVGGFYIDSGLIGVIVYMSVFGILVRVLFEYWRRNPEDEATLLLYAGLLPIIILVLRGSFADTAGRMPSLIGPYLIAFYVGQRALRGSSRRAIRA
jgi:hypothetical protein